MTRRSLDIPGVTVVLAYVHPYVRYKAFNPLVKGAPDLESTMLAVIHETLADKKLPDPVSGSSQGLEQSLRDHFAGLPPTQRGWIEHRSSEKFLGTQNVRVRPLTIEDLSALPFQLPSVKRVAQKLLPEGTTHEESKKRLRHYLETVDPPVDKVPPIRGLQSGLHQLLTGAPVPPGGHEWTPEELGAALRVAIDIENVLLQARGEPRGAPHGP